MKHSSIIFLVLFSLLITNAQSRTKTVTTEQHVKKRSLLVHGNITQAPMTISNFEKGGDSGGPSDCDRKYHLNSELIVALSTKWYNKGDGCFIFVTIYFHDKSVKAMVIDKCRSKSCPDNIVVASRAVWEALQVPQSEWGEAVVTFSVPATYINKMDREAKFLPGKKFFVKQKFVLFLNYYNDLDTLEYLVICKEKF
ncbi:hypothetical protein LXL04_022658 [Taraxacum kok-saghyz]